MAVLVVGATGATGQHLVRHLLERGQHVKAIVRSADRLPDDIRHHPNLSIISASVLNLSDAELAQHVQGCSAVASCLGHNMSLKGLYGQPRRLVTDAVRRLCDAIVATQPTEPVRVVLMNTAGNSNRGIPEKVSVAERWTVGLIRLLLPPHADNEQAADYLRTQIGPHHAMLEWVVVRPDTLTDEHEVTDYALYPSPIRSAIFNAGLTSRINVGHFMAELMTNDDLWYVWKGQMPIIYNKSAVEE